MKHVSFVRALAVAACILSVAPGSGASQTPPPRPAAGLAEAQALIRTGKFEEALAVLRPLARGDRASAQAVFRLGLAAVGAAQKPGIDEDSRDALLDEAIAAFRAMLVRRPELVRVRLELARAFFLKGEDSLARRHFEQVLAGKPPAGVALNVNRFLAQIRARKRWSVRVGAALVPDTNIGAGSDEKTILIDTPFGRLPFTYQGDEPESGIGISMWAGGEYQYPLGDPGTGSGASRWRLRAGGDVRRREYKASRFDQTALAGHVGPRWLIGRASEASLLLSGLHVWTGSGIEDPSHRDIGVRVEGRHRLNRRTTASLNLSRHERRYDDDTHLDGPLTDIVAGIGWVASPTVRIDSLLGWGDRRTDRKRERHSWRWMRLGATMLLPYGFTVGGAGTLRWTDYEGSWAPFVLGGGPRRDLVRSIRLNVHNRAFTVGGFSPEASVTQEQRTSNAQLHGYERISGELRFVRLF